jgi:hypothetical protein
MSLVAFKKKSVIQYGSKRSGKPPGGYWLSQGPFGKGGLQYDNYGPVGFSINGGHRNVGYVGKDSKFSRNGTPFRGTEPLGCGGTFGRYPRPRPVYNDNRVIVLGTQYRYIKQSVLSTRGMLQKKYKWAYNGQYPNNWVQPNYTGNQTESGSQGLYLHDKTTSNMCIKDVNDTETYEGNKIICGPKECSNNAPYTKTLYQPLTSSQHTLYIQKKCSTPIGEQKPFPYAVQTGTGILTGGINVSNVGSACNTSNNYLSPPAWYTK